MNRDIILIILICLCAYGAIEQTVRVQSRRAQTSRIRGLRRPVERRIEL